MTRTPSPETKPLANSTTPGDAPRAEIHRRDSRREGADNARQVPPSNSRVMSDIDGSGSARPAARQPAQDPSDRPDGSASDKPSHDDSPLESIGKALVSPIWGAAEDDERRIGNAPEQNGRPG